jgi:rhodanese-related sulfurtransferase
MGGKFESTQAIIIFCRKRQLDGGARMHAWWLVIILLAAAVLLIAGLLRGRPADEVEIKPEELYRQLGEGGVTVLDVREPEEYQDGHIPGAVLVPLRTLQVKLPSIPRERSLVTVCRSGRRSAAAAAELKAAGVEGVRSLAGGMATWHYEVERGSGTTL